MRSFEIVALALLLASTSFGFKRAIIAGGSCAHGRDNIPNRENEFFSSYSALIPALANRGWNVSAQYDGATARCRTAQDDPACADETREDFSEHSCCVAIDPQKWRVQELAKETHRAPSAFSTNTKANFLHLLDEAIQEGERAQAQGQPPGEVYLHFLAHGRPAPAHELCFEDGPVSVNDPEITQRLERLKKVAKIGIADDSCYGGTSVSALSKFGCVISGTSENRPAKGGVDSNLLLAQSVVDMTGKGGAVSLDDVHLRSLLATPPNPLVINQPQSSDDADVNSVASAANLLIHSPGRMKAEWGVTLEGETDENRCQLVQSSLEELNHWLSSSFQPIYQEAIRQDADRYLSRDLPSWGELVSGMHKDLDEYAKGFAEFEKARLRIQEIQKRLDAAKVEVDLSAFSPQSRAQLRKLLGGECATDSSCLMSEMQINDILGGKPGLIDEFLEKSGLGAEDQAQVRRWAAEEVPQISERATQEDQKFTDESAELKQKMADSIDAKEDKAGHFLWFTYYDKVAKLRARISAEANDLRFYEIEMRKRAAGPQGSTACAQFAL